MLLFFLCFFCFLLFSILPRSACVVATCLFCLLNFYRDASPPQSKGSERGKAEETTWCAAVVKLPPPAYSHHSRIIVFFYICASPSFSFFFVECELSKYTDCLSRKRQMEKANNITKGQTKNTLRVTCMPCEKKKRKNGSGRVCKGGDCLRSNPAKKARHAVL